MCINNEEFSLLLDTTHDVIYNEIIATMRFSILRFSCYTTSSTVSTKFSVSPSFFLISYKYYNTDPQGDLNFGRSKLLFLLLFTIS